MGHRQGFERLLARTGDDVPGTRRAKVRAFEAVLLAGLVSEPLHAALLHSRTATAGDWFGVVAAAVFAALAIPYRRVGLAGLLLLQLSSVVSTFPMTANHAFLQLFALAVLAACDLEHDAERQLALRSLRWLFLTLFFYAGLQKLAHGYYFRGEYFAYQLSRDSFASVLQYLTTAPELERFTVAFTRQAGEGPYRFEGPLMIALSNGAWLGEIGISAALLVQRTRTAAVAAALVFIAATELMARELHFGALFVAGVLLFLPSDGLRRALPAFAALYAWMLAVRIGLAPAMVFY